jgi:hypothetical protein
LILGRRRRWTLVLVALALVWTVAASLHQALWSWRYWRVDPWSERSPVQWKATSQHVASLGAQLRRALAAIEEPIPEGAVLAVSPDPSLGEQGFYLYLWTAYLLPEWEVRRVSRPEEGFASDYWLVFGGATSDPRLERLERLRVAKSEPLPPVTLFRVSRPAPVRPAPVRPDDPR